jgi:type VI secretion system protein ImpJ
VALWKWNTIMSWYSKVAWREGMFLQPQHLQQQDRYHEYLLDARTRAVTPYPWGVLELAVDTSLLQQGKVGFRRISGLFPDGAVIDLPQAAPLPDAVDVPDDAAGHFVWMTMPDRTVGTREVSARTEDGASRFVLGQENVIDAASAGHSEQVVELAHPRVELTVRSTPRKGYQVIPLARIVEVRDRIVTLDPKHVPPAISIHAHPELVGYLNAVLGWIGAKHEELARYAEDPVSGGTLTPLDFVTLQVLNREIGPLRHMQNLPHVHPERLYEVLLRIAGELATITSENRMARVYAPYDQGDLRETFSSVLADIQRALSIDLGRPKRLPLSQFRSDSYWAPVENPALFRSASFIIEVSTNRPLAQVQQLFPQLCKVGPTSAMETIVNSNMPGIPISHLPNPRGIRVIDNNVYFVLDKSAPLWSDFSHTPAIGLHFAGDWPELKLELWAVPEDA